MEKVVICGKFRALKCPQNGVIRDKGQRETCVFTVGVVLWNPQILIAYPQSIAIQHQFSALNPPFSILQIFFIKPQCSIVNSSSSILTQKERIFEK